MSLSPKQKYLARYYIEACIAHYLTKKEDKVQWEATRDVMIEARQACVDDGAGDGILATLRLEAIKGVKAGVADDRRPKWPTYKDIKNGKSSNDAR